MFNDLCRCPLQATPSAHDYESDRYKLMLTIVMFSDLCLVHYRYKLMLTIVMFNNLCHCPLQATPAPACCAPSAPVATSHPTNGCCRRLHTSLNSSPADSASWQNVSWTFAVVCSLSYALCSLSYALCSLGYSAVWSLGYSLESWLLCCLESWLHCPHQVNLSGNCTVQ